MAERARPSDKRTRGQTTNATMVMSSPTAQNSQSNKETEVSIVEILLARFDRLEDKMDSLDIRLNARIEQLQAKLDEDIERLDTKIEATNEKVGENSSKIDSINGEINLNRVEDSKNKKEIALLKRQLDIATSSKNKMADKINDIEDKTRVLNIKLEGKAEDPRENLNNYIQEITKIMDVNDVRPCDYTASRLGKRQIDHSQTGYRGKPRVILITFNNLNARNRFFYARAKIGKSDQHKGIYINDDVSNTTRKHRDEFRAIAALARSKGDDVRVHGDGVVVNGRKFKHGDSMPEYLTLSKAKVVEMHDQIYFQSEHAHLSNFHPAPIMDGGEFFHTAEHHYQAAKCRAMGDLHKLALVKVAETPLDAKRVGDSIQETAEWRGQKEEKMVLTINLKYDQNPKLAQLLINTGDKQLNEATVNNFFGIGVTLHSKALRDRAYGGLNKLGEILQNKRRELKK